MIWNNLCYYNRQMRIICDQPHNKWTEYIWYYQVEDSPHNSSHLFDTYTFVHILTPAFLYYILSFLVDNKITIFIIVVLIVIIFEIVENNQDTIMVFMDAGGNVSSKYIVNSVTKKPYIYYENGKEYKFLVEDKKIMMIHKNGEIIEKREINLSDLSKYNVHVYKGDTLINIIGDIFAGIVGALIIMYFLTTENGHLYCTSFIALLFIIVVILIPNSINESTAFIMNYLNSL